MFVSSDLIFDFVSSYLSLFPICFILFCLHIRICKCVSSDSFLQSHMFRFICSDLFVQCLCLFFCCLSVWLVAWLFVYLFVCLLVSNARGISARCTVIVHRASAS
jgi:hypothetical protein